MKKLKIIIIQKGYTIRDVSQKCDLSEQTLSNWINGRNTNTIFKIYKLCKFLDIDIKDLF